MSLVKCNISLIALPESTYFSKDDVKEFEKTITTCLACSSSCKGKTLANFLIHIGLDEFEKLKKNDSLPDEIRSCLHSMNIAMNISFDNHALIYGKL